MTSRLELMWPGKDKFLLVPKDADGKPVWVERDHPAASEVRLADFSALSGTDVADHDATCPVVARVWPAAVKPLEGFLCMSPRCPDAVRITREKARAVPALLQIEVSAPPLHRYRARRGQPRRPRPHLPLST